MTSLGPRVAMALCCLLAGCGGAPTDTRAGGDTLTPVAVPTSHPSAAATPEPRATTPGLRTEAELAPGVTGTGVEAPFRLSGDGETRYRRVDDSPFRGPADDLTLRGRIAGLLSSVETAVVGREPGEPVRVILVARDVRSDSVLEVPVLLERPRNASVTLEVGVDGVVREYRIAHDATFDGERVRVVRHVRFEFVEGPIEPPSWYETAPNATGPPGPRPGRPEA